MSILRIHVVLILLALILGTVFSRPENDFGKEHFLKQPVGEPHVHEVDDVNSQDDGLDLLLHRIYKKVALMNSGKGIQEHVMGKDGFAYKKHKYIPSEEKRGEHFIDEKGKAAPMKSRIPSGFTSNNKRDGNNEVRGGWSEDRKTLKDLTNSVDALVEELNKKQIKPNTQQVDPYQHEKPTYTHYLRPENKGKRNFIFRDVQDGENEGAAKRNSFMEFKEKFRNTFLKDTQSSQHIINTGKDSPDRQKQKQLDKLYEQLKQQTQAEADKIRTIEKKEQRRAGIKREIVDLLNRIQQREVFTYDGTKFDLAGRKTDPKEDEGPLPHLINIGKDQRVTNEKKESSKLDTVGELIEELRHIKGQKAKKEIPKISDKTRSADEKTNLNIKRKAKLKDMLTTLMNQLEKRVTSTTIKHNDNTTKKLSTEKRLEADLEKIATSLDKTDKKTQKALAGFDIKDSLKQKTKRDTKKYDRP